MLIVTQTVGILNPRELSGLLHPYQMDKSISVSGVFTVFFIFIQLLKLDSVS